MTDGPTGIQVAPITEDDMNRVKSILQRAADAIVGASQMANDIAAMRAELDALKADSERLRNQNNALDEALNHSREMRDNQARELASTKDQLSQVTLDRDNAHNDYLAEKAKADDLQAKLAQAKHDADQWADEADKLTKSLEEAHNKLEDIRDAHEKAFGAMQAAVAEPVPVPPVPTPVQIDPWPSDPSPVTEPAPAPPVEAETSLDWKPGFNWDNVRQLYVKQS